MAKTTITATLGNVEPSADDSGVVLALVGPGVSIVVNVPADQAKGFEPGRECTVTLSQG